MSRGIRRIVALGRTRLARDERGFTLLELMIVMLIFGILIAVALPSYLSFKDRAQKTTAKENVSVAAKAVAAYGADNFPGSRDDPDLPTADDLGYANISLDALAARYDASIPTTPGAPYVINPALFVPAPNASQDFCLTASIGRWTAVKHGPTGAIEVGTTFTAPTCTVSGG